MKGRGENWKEENKEKKKGGKEKRRREKDIRRKIEREKGKENKEVTQMVPLKIRSAEHITF